MTTDPAAIDLEAIKWGLSRGDFSHTHTHNLIAAVEALRERVGALEGVCHIVIAELPQDDEGIEIRDLERLLCACRAVIAATPAEADALGKEEG